MTRRTIVEDHGLPLISIGKDDGWLAPIASEPSRLARSAGHASGAESGTGQPYDLAPDLTERFAAERAVRYVRLVGLFLALCSWIGAELATAFAFREFAVAPLAAAACFGFVANRVWAALA